MRRSASSLALFLAWQAWKLHAFIAAEVRPPAWDQANHMQVAWKYFSAISAGNWGDVWFYTPNGTMPPFPPLYHLGLALAYFSTNPASAALWLNWFYLCLLAVSIFAIVWRFRRDATAPLAAILICCTPLIQGLLHTQLVDLALTAVVALAYWALLRTEGFQSRGGSLAFGAVFALGLMHKWSFFTYMFPAFFVAGQALRGRKTRRNVLLAAGVAALFGLPWYLVRLPLVVVRLTQATNDFVVPFWRGAAFFQYARWLPAELGWVFLILAGVGAWRWRKNGSRGAGLISLWVLSSYLFWALIPNRQMRFLAPGLPGLAVLATETSAPAIGVAAAYAFVSASRGRSLDAPAREDWKLAEIVDAIATQARGGPSLIAVTVIANDERFNKLGFIWTADARGLDNMQFRGVHDIPWELSPFIIWKTGRLGPEVVVADFLNAQAEIANPHGWFQKAFEERGRWPLPDGSSAVLFGRKHLLKPPFVTSRVHLPLYSSLPFEISRADIAFGRWDAKRGTYRRASISSSGVRFKGVEIGDFRIDLDDAVLVPDRDGARLLRIGKVTIKDARVGAAAANAFLTRAGIRVKSLAMDGTIRAVVSVKGLPVSGELSAATGDATRRCRLSLISAAVGPLPLPTGILLRYGANGPLFDVKTVGDRTALRTIFGLTRTLPFPVELGGCSAQDGEFRIF